MPNTPNQKPEKIARDKIDTQLEDAGWAVQDNNKINFSVGLGVAIREYQTDIGPADYALFVDKKAVGIIEAKPADCGHRITTVEEQSGGYAKATLKWVKNKEILPFVYESTGTITRFTNFRDPKPRSREVFNFPQPEALLEAFKNKPTLRTNFNNMPEINLDGLRACQISAVSNLEASLKEDRPRSLIQMATGSGKTFTAISSVYRWLKYGKAKRILFLVDTKNLGIQAEEEFFAFTPNDENRKFTELYTVSRLKSSYMPKDAEVCICTIQRLYSILKGEELDESLEEVNPAEQYTMPKKALPVVYNNKIPPEFFDLIIVDECHRSIYNTWRQVLEYFDSYLVGLTATPDNRTYAFFNQNIVSEYNHEKAVADGVNVGNEVYVIETDKSKSGGTIKAEQAVIKRERLTRKKRWETQDEDETYTAKQLDRNIVNPSQIRTIIQTFRDKLPEMFPNREEVPKTLVFAKTDSHADDIIQTIREEFGEGNEFCKKITYKAEENPKSVLAQFRNAYNPRIAVTVDMIATGTDIRPLECLLFMRDVKSRNYFEQMKGRGTRIVDKDALRKVTPSAISGKTHYVIVDAIGVTKSLKTSSQPLITKPSVSLKDLAMGVMMGARDEDTVSSLAGRLARLNNQLDTDDQQRIEEKTGGVPLTAIVGNLLSAIDPDKVNVKACKLQGVADDVEPSEGKYQEAQDELVNEASNVFNGDLIDLLENIRKDKEQTIDHEGLDTLIDAGWQGDAKENAETMVHDFETYLQENKDEIEALTIFYSQPARRQTVTLKMIKDVMHKLRADRPKLSPVRVWHAYELLDERVSKQPVNELTALMGLIRRATGVDEKITLNSERIRKNYQSWIMSHNSSSKGKFTEEQMEWLKMLRDHVITSFSIERDDLEMAPFDARGGLGKMHQLFGENMDDLIEELNKELAA
jgi:type I restriction enzyme R subunit